jgi:serine/threonine protein kinase
LAAALSAENYPRKEQTEMGTPSRIDSLKTIGKYALIEKLSEGYLGPVYRSFDPELERTVEIRILCDGIRWDADIVDLFRKECEAIIRLGHPNIASIIEVSTDGPFPHMVLEPLGDRTLRKLLARETGMSFEAKLSVMIQLVEGLGHAHGHGILHRNLCPENIYLSADGCIKIRDFAVAHILMKHLPHPGVRWGAPIYLSPEQIEHKQCNEQSDIFSMGTVFYELLTGVHPFHDADSNRALDNILKDNLIPTFEKYPEYHPRIWHILKKCLARNQKDRYGNIAELSAAYRGLLKEMSEDVQLMLRELQASFASLRIIAERPGAGKEALRLYGSVRDLLQGVEDADYTRLDLLISDLIKIYPRIRDAAGKNMILDSIIYPRIRSEELDLSQCEDTCVELQDPDCARPDPATEEGSSGTDQKEIPKPLAKEILHEDAPPDAPREAAEAGRVEDALPVVETGDENVPAADRPESQDEEFSGCAGVPAQADAPGPEIPVEPVFDEETAPVRNPEESGMETAMHRRTFQWKFPRIPRPSYRTMALLLAILLTITAVGVVRKNNTGDALRSAWKNWIVDAWVTVKASAPRQSPQEESPDVAIETPDVSVENSSAGYEDTMMDEMEAAYPGEGSTSPLPEKLDRIEVLIGSGKLEQAEVELARLGRIYPKSSEIGELRRQLQVKESRASQDLKQKERDQLEEVRKKEGAWNGQFTNFFSRGEYKEAENVVGLWSNSIPNSAKARESGEALREVQSRIAASLSAIQDRRYGEALSELSVARRLNPSDPNVTALQGEIESRMASAKGSLSVLRLGDRGAVLLDGRRIGSDGEVRDTSVSAGSHTVAVEKDGYLVASRTHEFVEDQTMTLVYDLAQRSLRPMVEQDRDLIAQRKIMEEVHSFRVEHNHGFLRGSCSGVLLVGYHEVVYRPDEGNHGFQVPFNLLKIERDKNIVDLFFISDNEHFQKFKFEDEQAAVLFSQVWHRLKSLSH